MSSTRRLMTATPWAGNGLPGNIRRTGDIACGLQPFREVLAVKIAICDVTALLPHCTSGPSTGQLDRPSQRGTTFRPSGPDRSAGERPMLTAIRRKRLTPARRHR